MSSAGSPSWPPEADLLSSGGACGRDSLVMFGRLVRGACPGDGEGSQVTVRRLVRRLFPNHLVVFPGQAQGANLNRTNSYFIIETVYYYTSARPAMGRCVCNAHDRKDDTRIR